jgi:hypothetical protein
MERADGFKEWYLNGKRLTKTQIRTFEHLQTCSKKELLKYVGTIFDPILDRRQGCGDTIDRKGRKIKSMEVSGSFLLCAKKFYRYRIRYANDTEIFTDDHEEPWRRQQYNDRKMQEGREEDLLD